MKLSKKVINMDGSGIRKIADLSLKYNDKITFTIGEPDFTASEEVVEEAYKAIKAGKTKYTSNEGIIELREAICKDLELELGIKYDPYSEIIVTVGGMGSLYTAFLAILDKGDEVIVSNPYWSNYTDIIEMCNGIPVLVDVKEEDGFIYDPQNIKEAISKKTKAIIINSPANPTGGVASKETLKEISDICKEHNLIVISDEVYRSIIFDGYKHVSIATMEGMKERTVVINSFSKEYAMTGWRLGYSAAPATLIKAMCKLQENIVGCAVEANQYAGVKALQSAKNYSRSMTYEYEKRRNYILDRIENINKISCIKPKGAFYAFINIKKTGLSSEEFAIKLLKEKQVVVVPGNAFGSLGEGYIRLSFATSMENIKEGLDRIEEFIENLQ